MIRKALHIIMAAVVLISTMGVIINMHFCHDHLIDLALYSPAGSCCDVSNEVPCDPQEGLSQMDHCEDDSIVLEALEGFVVSSLVINFDKNQSKDILFWITFQHSSHGINKDVKSIFTDSYFPSPYQEVELSQIQSYLI